MYAGNKYKKEQMGKKHDRSDENCGLGREIEIVEGWSCDETYG